MLGLGLNNIMRPNVAELTYRNVLSTRVASWRIEESTLILRRDSDDDEQTFEAISGRYLDTVGILAWSGSDSVYVTQMSDSVGNNVAIQIDNTKQPRLVDAGTFETLDDGSYAMFFDDTDDHFVVLDISGLDITNTIFSIVAKHNPSASGYICSRDEGTLGTRQYALFMSGTDGINFYLEGAEYGTDEVTTFDVDKLSVVTSDGTNAKVYLDSVLKDTTAFSSALTSRPNMFIGCRGSNAGGTTQSTFYGGKINCIDIYNTALTQSQINLLRSRM